MNPGLSVTIYEVAAFVAVAHEKAMKPENIKSGFRKSGIYTFDRSALTEDDF